MWILGGSQRFPIDHCEFLYNLDSLFLVETSTLKYDPFEQIAQGGNPGLLELPPREPHEPMDIA